MISKEKQEHIKWWVSKQEGRPYPCSNQIVKKSIILRDSSRIAAFEQAYPHFVCYRRTRGWDTRYINPRTEELWQVIIASENCRGYRHYKAIINSAIDEDIFNIVIAPCMSGYCCNVEFFDWQKIIYVV